MPEGQPTAPSAPSRLTVETAVPALVSLLSESEHKQPREPKPAKKPEAPAPEEREDEGDEPAPQGDEPDPAEQSGDEPESETDGEEAGEQTPEPRKHRVKVDGQELEVTEDELVKGYSRNEDYTRKTQALAEQRKAHEAEVAQVKTERQKYAAALQEIEDVMRAQVTSEPDWEKLARENPTEFPSIFAQYQIHEKNVNAVAAEKQRTLQKLAEDGQREYQAHMQTEMQKLVEAVPAWKDDTVRKAEKGKVIEYAKSIGYSDKDLAAISDHRILVMVNKARLYDEGQRKLPAVRDRIQQVKTATPGPATATKRTVSEATKANQRLAQTGKLRHAAAAIQHLLED